MFKKLSIIAFSILLGTMSVCLPLQAMFDADIWQGIKEEEALKLLDQDDGFDQRERLNDLLDLASESLTEEVIEELFIEPLLGFKPEGHIKPLWFLCSSVLVGQPITNQPLKELLSIAPDLNMIDSIKMTRAVHDIRDFLQETSGIKEEAAKKILRSLCNRTNSKFNRLSSEQKEECSLQFLQYLFEKGVKYRTIPRILIEENPITTGFLSAVLFFVYTFTICVSKDEIYKPSMRSACLMVVGMLGMAYTLVCIEPRIDAKKINIGMCCGAALCVMIGQLTDWKFLNG